MSDYLQQGLHALMITEQNENTGGLAESSGDSPLADGQEQGLLHADTNQVNSDQVTTKHTEADTQKMISEDGKNVIADQNQNDEDGAQNVNVHVDEAQTGVMIETRTDADEAQNENADEAGNEAENGNKHSAHTENEETTGNIAAGASQINNRPQENQGTNHGENEEVGTVAEQTGDLAERNEEVVEVGEGGQETLEGNKAVEEAQVYENDEEAPVVQKEVDSTEVTNQNTQAKTEGDVEDEVNGDAIQAVASVNVSEGINTSDTTKNV